MIAAGLSLKRTGLLLASVLVAALILALFEPLIDTGWRPASWDVPHLIGNVYLFSLVGAASRCSRCGTAMGSGIARG